MQKLEALLIGGYWPDVMMAALGLLTRAGFTVDVISTSNYFKKNKLTREYLLAENNDLLLEAASRKIKHKYNLVVIADDPTLGAILNSDLHNEEKLELLPVVAIQDFNHIFSKIGLSLALEKNGVNTPAYLIAQNGQELKNSAQILGYPMLVKIDSSAGGLGVFECSSDSNLEALVTKLRDYPVLMQKKMKGIEVSMEAFYQNGNLIHFAYSTPEKYKYKFGPTSVRTYVQLACLEKEVFRELDLIGKVLGADGFVNISSIRSDEDDKLYFIEADMRPNLWINHSKYFGDDAAGKINRYFSTGGRIGYPYPFNPEYPQQILISHYSRITLRELILNRYQVWKHLPESFLYLTLRYRMWVWIISTRIKLYKFLPKHCRLMLKNTYRRLTAR